MTAAHERLTLAMVATEAAMVREQDPARYARLERRNLLLGARQAGTLIRKNIIRLRAVPAGATIAQPHLLNDLGAVVPDFVNPSVQGFTITADATNVTVTNTGSVAADVDVFVEYWHAVESPDDRFWLSDVEAGLWTPAGDFSNCLVPALSLVQLLVDTHAVVEGVRRSGLVRNILSLPRDGSLLLVLSPATVFREVVLEAHGGAVDVGLGREALVEGCSLRLLNDGCQTILLEPTLTLFACNSPKRNE
jgi:hypothetical protein